MEENMFDCGHLTYKVRNAKKMKFVNNVILFQKLYKNVINLCLGGRRFKSCKFGVLDAHVWVICKTIIKMMLYVVK